MATPRIVLESQMPADLDQRIRDGLCASFPVDNGVFSHTRAWHGSAPAYSVVMEKDGQVIAHVGVVDRTIRVGGIPLRAAGIQNVFVRPAFRGLGFCDQVMNASMAEALRQGFDCGLLFCVPRLAKVYAVTGWQTLGERTVIRVDNGQEVAIPDKNITMYLPLVRPEFPDGVIHLQGNDW